MKPVALLPLAVFIGAASVPAVHANERDTQDRNASGSVVAFMPEARLSGVVRADYFRSSRDFDSETGFPGATAQVKSLPRYSEAIDGKLELRLTQPAVGKGGAARGRLLEGYVTVHFDHADLRIGKQIVAWGRADGINPTDNLTPRDYAVMLPFEDDQRFGTNAVKLDAYLSQEYTVTVFASPFFTPSRIPLPAAGLNVIDTRPAKSLAHTSAGLKLNKTGDGFDWSVSAFHGYSLLPDMRLIASTPTGPTVELQYNRITVLGTDFSRNFGRFGLRGEMAIVNTEEDRSTNSRNRKPYLSWILGADRTFFENLNVNLQFFQRRIRRFQDPATIADPVARNIAIQNAVIGGQRDRLNSGISFRVSNKWFNDTLEAEIFAVVNHSRNDRLVRPLLTYAFSDQWKGTIGAELYRGAADTQFGSLKTNRGAFAELRYGF